MAIAGHAFLRLKRVSLVTVGKIKQVRKRTRKDGKMRSQGHLSGVDGVYVTLCADKWKSQGTPLFQPLDFNIPPPLDRYHWSNQPHLKEIMRKVSSHKDCREHHGEGENVTRMCLYQEQGLDVQASFKLVTLILISRYLHI